MRRSYRWRMAVVVVGLLVFIHAPVYGYERVSFGNRGAVVCADPRVAHIGIEILRAGGNAVDAAVAIGFALAVTYPQAGNIGGGGFMLVFEPGAGVHALDFREVAPHRAHRDMYLDEQGQVIPRASLDGYRAVGVPGTVHGLYTAHRKFGRWSWRRLLEPAIRLAKKGFATSSALFLSLRRAAKRLRRDPEIARVFYDPDGRPRSWIVQKDLARTLEAIARRGPDGFYRGPVARAIARAMKKNGGLITLDDLAAYRSKWRTPVQFRVGDAVVYSMPPPSAGGWTLAFLFGVLKPREHAYLGWHSVAHVNRTVEAMKRAFALRARYLGDPDFVTIPNLLFDPAWMERVARTLRPLEVTPAREIQGDALVTEASTETTHFAVIDGEGRAVSVTYTINGGFGAGVMVPDAGFLLNNEMDDFSIKPGHPNMFGAVGDGANAIEPRKRMLSSMTPTLVVRDGKVIGALGAPGGTRIPTAVFQVLENLLAFGMSPEPAVRAGRFHHQWYPDELWYEPLAFGADTLRMLKGLGYTLHRVSSIGRVQLIWAYEGGYLAVADPRSPGGAAGLRD